jgi:hypothetical protein
MKKVLISIVLTLMASFAADAQTRSAPKTTKAASGAVQTQSSISRGTVAGGVYTNPSLGLTVPLPESWIIANSEFVSYMKGKGVDISPRPPRAADLLSQKKVDDNFKRLNVLVTAYRSPPGTAENAMIRIAEEDIRLLDTSRPVNDAVDYIDLMRSQLGSVKMPAGYSFSETQAEQLGPNQFAYLDTDDSRGKTRIYVTVRRGRAILLSISYVAVEDLETFRDVLARTRFALK